MNRYRFITSAVLLTLAVSLILVSCRDGGTASGKGREVELRYATHLTMEEHDGYTVASIRNPWDTTKDTLNISAARRGAPLHPKSLPECRWSMCRSETRWSTRQCI